MFILQILRNIKAAKHDGTMPNYKINKNEYGTIFAVKSIVYKWISLLTDYHYNPYQRLIEDLCENEFGVIRDLTPSPKTENNTIILDGPVAWTFWWQGIDNAPELVKVCIDSQRKYFASKRISHIVIDESNMKDYVTLPDYILNKVKHGNITLTHLSDILRAELLRTYGGVWIDATILFTGDLGNEFFDLPFYTNKKHTYPAFQRRVVSKGRWTGYFLKGDAHMSLFELMSAAFKMYWAKHDHLVEYFMIDYVINYGYNTNSDIRSCIDNVPENNEGIFELNRLLPETLNKSAVETLLSKNAIHKLSYKNMPVEAMNNPSSTWTWVKTKFSKQ